MQPCYGITHDRLSKMYGDLRNTGAGPAHLDAGTRGALFLAGLNYSFSYYKASATGSPHEKHLGPAHLLDDGLSENAQIVLKRLMRAARSRETTQTIDHFEGQGLANEEWSRIQLSWTGGEELVRAPVAKWISRNTPEDSWLRLCLAVGMRSMWATESVRFIHAMMRKPFTCIIPSLDGDGNRRVADIILAFNRNHELDLKEL